MQEHDNAPRQEEVILFSAGAIPGIPGEHAAGQYLVDWGTRTITPILPEPAFEPAEGVQQETGPEALKVQPEGVQAEPSPETPPVQMVGG